jgi:iron complex transport system ATP-binding protein
MLSLRSVSIELDGNSIVEDVDLVVEQGEFVGIVGPNGAGKTTLLGGVVGVVRYTGEIRIDGRPVDGMTRRERARAVALVPQRPMIPPGMSVMDYVLIGRTPHLGLLATESTSDYAAAEVGLRSLDLEHMADREMASLSGGEIQRVVLARALVGHAQRVLGQVDAMRRSCGLTVVAAIHDLTLAAQVCDRLVMMSGGRVVSEGRPVSVLTESSIRAHYGATVRVLDEGDGRVVVIPTRSDQRESEETASAMEQT